MEYMFEAGFLGTRAPFFMDTVTIIVALLPLLITLAVMLAKKGHYKAHKLAQLTLFIVSVIVVGYFEYGVRLGGGFETFVQDSSLNHSFIFYFLIFHILIALITLYSWIKTIVIVLRNPNTILENSTKHKALAKRTILWINATAITGIGVYLLLFVF
ncbi:MAG: DUF420 domain-containing protein [Campylobacterales bacterium]|nr:DUF420 domain-containing protein [Campylobacterales bacterium]